MMKKTICAVAFILSVFLLASCSSIQSKKTIRYLALGDSYTIGESVDPTKNFPKQLSAVLIDKDYDVEVSRIIAKTGWRTDDLLNAISKEAPGSDHNLVSLLIGVNDQYQGKDIKNYPANFTELLDKAIELAGGKKSNVFVLSIPDYGLTPFGQTKDPKKITNEIDAYNDINQRITDSYGINYVYITDITRRGLLDKALVAPDGLHPSGAAYNLFVDRIIDKLNL